MPTTYKKFSHLKHRKPEERKMVIGGKEYTFTDDSNLSMRDKMHWQRVKKKKHAYN